MRLWTVQDKTAYDDLCEKGVLHCDAALAEWLKEKNCCPWRFVQATFWELRKEQVVSVRKFYGKTSPIERRD